MSFFSHVVDTVDILKRQGVIIIAAAGNGGGDCITSDLNDGKSIMVGSHNNRNSISEFSVGKCKAIVCSRGEDVYIENPRPRIEKGTSFATPHVTAVVANFASHFQHQITEAIMREFLTESASDLFCDCNSHQGERSKSKLNPSSIMRHALGFKLVDCSLQ